MKDIPIENIVVFSILMENNQGILGKAPNYIEEKWLMVHDLKEPETLLDLGNLAKFRLWKER